MRNRNFYVARLRNASLSEVAYRAKQTFSTWQLGRLVKRNKCHVKVPVIELCDVHSLQLPYFKCNLDQDHIKQILDGQVFTLNTDRSGIEALEGGYRNLLSSEIKQADAFPDIRPVWEPARLQHVTTLLLSSLDDSSSLESIYIKQTAKNAILRWVRNNPFLLGPHYISAMECALRIPVFFYCLKTIDTLSPMEYRTILEAIYLHACWVSINLSLYSSLGNHTIAEAVGLIFAGPVFRRTKEGKQWLEKGFSLLKKELKHQILEDGGPAEQSLNYHRFVLDLYWLAVDFLETNNLYDCSDIKPRLIRGEDFLNSFQYDNRNRPSIGDSDDGFVVAPQVVPKRSRTNGPRRRINVFKYSGYTIINTENKATVTFDHGPLGMPPLYNHGHADALSITLGKEGRQILIDPGTYRYNGVPKWRRYFKGTRAHNAVTIDGMDQAVQETGFIWSHPYKVDLLNYSEQSDGLFVEAVHNGYSRLKEPVWHKRSILFFRETNFIIKDSFTGKGVHDFELNYHVHPDATVSKSDGWWHVDNKGSKLFIQLLGEDEFLFVHGQEKPLLGWYSPSYGIKRKSGVLSCTKKGSPREISFITVICTESPLDNKGALRFC